MVMAGPYSLGSVDQAQRWAHYDDPERDADRPLDHRGTGHHESLDLPGDPVPPLLVLATWEDDWRQTFGHGAAPHLASVETAAAYLDRTLAHAAQWHDAWDEFHGDLRATVARLENVLQEGEREERSRVPCTKCGTRLVRRYEAKVADDHWECPKCGKVYNKVAYHNAHRHHLASGYADRWVPLVDAIDATGRSSATVRSWVQREDVQSRRDPTTGRVYVWWPDVRAQDRNAERRDLQRGA